MELYAPSTTGVHGENVKLFLRGSLRDPKGSIELIRARGIETLHANLTTIASFIGDRVTELRDWNDLSLLTVRVDRLKEWYREGLLCIGDAAHAMSPVGGVGINLAIQDAVADTLISNGTPQSCVS